MTVYTMTIHKNLTHGNPLNTQNNNNKNLSVFICRDMYLYVEMCIYM